MLTIYACALVGVAVAIVGLWVEAMISVSRRAPWQLPRTHLSVVETADRRGDELPFVGRDRRAGAVAAEATQADDARNAA